MGKFPRTVPGRLLSEVGVWQNRRIQVVTYNIQYSKGKDGVHDPERIAAEVAGADIIALQEVVRNVPGVPDDDQPEKLAELLDGYIWVYGPALDLGTGFDRCVQFGIMLLSLYPILSGRILLLPRVGTIDRTSIERRALEGVIDAPGGPLRVYSVHLDHLNSCHRLEQIRWLRHVVLLAASTGTTLTGPPWDLFGVPIMAVPTTDDCLLMGDFNMLPGSPAYDEMVGEPDYYQGRTLITGRLADAWTSAGRGLDDGATWSDGDVFVNGALAHRVRSSHVGDEAGGSDHDPLWAELDL